MKKSGELAMEAYEFEGKLPLKQAIPLGLQHVLAMFVGNLTPLLIITGVCGIGSASEYADIQVALLQNAMIIAGVVTLIQLFAIGPVGGKVPIIMGTSSGFIGVFNSVAKLMGGGVLAYGAIMGASILGGLMETVLGAFLKPLRKFFPSVVTGTVVLSIGLSLISVGINSFGGGNTANDFGSMENMALATLVLIVILVMKHWGKGIFSSSSILVGIIVGYIVAAIMAMVLPHTAVNAEGVEYTKSWVLNWNKVAQSSWFAIPAFLPVKPVFDMRAIVPVLIMFVVTAVETIGDISGVIKGGMGREATDTELSGGVMCDGAGFWCSSKHFFQPERRIGHYDKGGKPYCSCKRCSLSDLMWSDPKAGGAGFYHASGRFRWGSSNDVLLHYRQRYPADHQRASDSKTTEHRIRSPWRWLWYGCQYCDFN